LLNDLIKTGHKYLSDAAIEMPDKSALYLYNNQTKLKIQL